jgi:hypothetical protein
VSALTVVVAPFARSETTLGIGALPQTPPTSVPWSLLLINSARQAWGIHINDTMGACVCACV